MEIGAELKRAVCSLAKKHSMPRQPRIDLPHIAQHVVQRGNDRRPCFFQDVDCLRYFSELRELAARAGCAIHACVLMTNHVYLLLTPSRGAGKCGHAGAGTAVCPLC